MRFGKIPGRSIIEKLRVIMLTSIYSQADLGKRLIWHAESDLAGSNSHRSSGHGALTLLEKLLIYEHARA
jgi:hypothetical protein